MTDAAIAPDPEAVAAFGQPPGASASPGGKPDAPDPEVLAAFGPPPGGPPAPQTQAGGSGSATEEGMAARAGVSMLAPRTYAAVATPEQNDFLATTSMGRILTAFGEGPKEAFDNGEFFTPEALGALKGTDVPDSQKSLWDGFKSGVLYPAAVELDRQYRIAMAVTQGPIVGAEKAVEQAGEEVAPGSGLGREGAGLIEFLATGAPGVHGVPEAPAESPVAARLVEARQSGLLPDDGRPGLPVANENMGIPRPLADAKQVGAIGQPPAVYFGVDEPKGATNDNIVRVDDAVGAPTPPADVHEAARQIAPDVFDKYDPLAQRQDELRQQISDARAKLQSDYEAQAPHAAEIADLQARLQDTTPRLAKKYQARLDALTPDYDAFLADEDQHALVTRDTPEISAMRQELLETDYRLRDLAPDVTAAYDEAAKQFPVEETAPEAPAATPEEISQNASAGLEKEAAATPEEITAPEPDAARQEPTESIPDIAADTSAKLQAAGRPAEEADAAGQVTKALWETRAARFEGKRGTAEEMYAREAPDIRGEESASKKLVREYAQKGAKGAASLMQNGRSVITIMRKADASTFIHETGHDWLERLMRDAADPVAPERMKADAQTLRDYLKVEGGNEIPRAAHEKFARSFERYFMEGRAPSKALADVFSKFKQWLTTIYQTVTNLRAPITPDIRDVFDRLLSTEPDRQASIVPERAEEASPREFISNESRPGATDLYTKVKEPERLASYLRRIGGIDDVGGDIKHMLGGAKYRPGLINKKGLALDDAALRAHEAGYFPELSMDNRPSINDLLNALEGDVKGTEPRYSHFDDAKVEAFHEAAKHNSEIDRLAGHYGIKTDGMTREQFFNTLSESLSREEQAREIESMGDALQAEYDDAIAAAKEWLEEHDGEASTADDILGIDHPRSLEELEGEYRSQDATGPAGQGLSPVADAGHAGGRAESGQEGGGQGGRDSGDAGRSDEAVRAAGSEPAGPDNGAAAGGERGAGPERLAPLDVEGSAPDFRTKQDQEVEKAANIRLDKINATEDMNAALRQLAEQNGDFMDARYGSAAYRTQLDIRNTRILLRSATSDMMQAAEKAMSGDPNAIADYATKEQRAAMIFDHLSTLSADWAHAGHELNKVMDGWEQAKLLGQAAAKDDEGRTLFQKDWLEKMRARAALMLKMDDPEQAAKFASDSAKTPWEITRSRIIAYYVNALISGPITHMAYMVGNEMTMLYRAIPETAAAATTSAVYRAMGAEGERTYFGEVSAQLYGQMAGARAGIFPAWQAVKTGIADLPGDAQGELGVGLGARPQVLPGKVGYVLETPSRVVQGIHTLFYTMNYSAEVARLAYRAASDKGLDGNAFDTEVARLRSNPTAAMMEQATRIATRGVLMKRPEVGSLQAKIADVMNNPHPLMLPVKLAAPFMQIGMNILQEGMLERTPLALLSAEARAELLGSRGGAARDQRIAQIATGSTLGMVAYGLAAQGAITGGGPSDPRQRAVWLDQGNVPYAIRIGNTLIPYRKYLGPLGPLVATAADFHEIGAHMGDEELTKTASSIAFAFSEVVADETWMAGLSSFVHAVSNWDTDGERWLRSTASSFLPASSMLRQTARFVDPYQRQARTLLDAVKNTVPGLSETLQPQIGLWGQPIGSHLMTSTGTLRQDPVDDRLQALDRGIAPIRREILGVRLTDQQYAQYASIAGRLAHAALMPMVQAPGFQALPPEQQSMQIDKVVERAREMARQQVQMADQSRAVQMRTAGLTAPPTIIEQATANKLRRRGYAH